MKAINLAVCNLAKTQLGVDLRKLVRAQQVQIDRDFLPEWDKVIRDQWGVGPSEPYQINLLLVDGYTDDYPIMLLLDDADQANALGYHERTAKGHPIGKVFVRTVLQDRERVSVTFSHETLELLGNPTIEPTIIDPKTGWKYPPEACDAVQSGSYQIDGIDVSNFIFPAWFDRNSPPGTRYDFRGSISKPFSLAQGGYTPVDQGQGWTQIFGESGAGAYNPAAHHRIPVLFLGQLRRVSVNIAAMQSHPVFAMGISWESLEKAVLKFGPEVLNAAAALLQGGLTVEWVTKTFQDLVDLYNKPAMSAALIPGIQTGLGGILGGVLQNLIANLLKNVDLQGILNQILPQILDAVVKAITNAAGNVGKQAALPVAE